MDDALPPIPTPAAHGWRRVRQQFLPGIVFLAGVAAAVVIWTQSVASISLVAEVETIRAEVRSVHAGALTNVTANLLQPVRAGDTLAQVVTTDPQVFDASLAVIRAELNLIRSTLNPVLGQQRSALDYHRLLLDLMGAKVTLAGLKSQLSQAEKVLDRTTTLYKTKLVTDEHFDEVKNSRDVLRAQLKAQQELVDRIEPELEKYKLTGLNGEVPSPAQGLRAAIKVQQEKLRLAEAQLRPVPLVAPIDGVVTLVHRKTGEAITVGEPIFQITAAGAAKIVGFIRQPVGESPKPGSTVEVRTRSLPRRSGTATIAQVGTQLEPISPTLLAALHLPVTHVPTELGLRVHVALPAGLALRPGEQVDLILRE